MVVFLCDDLRKLFIAQRLEPLIDSALIAASDGAISRSVFGALFTGGNVRPQSFFRPRFRSPLIRETAGFFFNNRTFLCSASNKLGSVSRLCWSNSDIVFFV